MRKVYCLRQLIQHQHTHSLALVKKLFMPSKGMVLYNSSNLANALTYVCLMILVQVGLFSETGLLIGFTKCPALQNSIQDFKQQLCYVASYTHQLIIIIMQLLIASYCSYRGAVKIDCLICSTVQWTMLTFYTQSTISYQPAMILFRFVQELVFNWGLVVMRNVQLMGIGQVWNEPCQLMLDPSACEVLTTLKPLAMYVYIYLMRRQLGNQQKLWLCIHSSSHVL